MNAPQLKASTPNLQDVSDLQQMLANLQEAHEAVIDQNSRLEAERTELRNKIEELEDDNKKLRDEKLALGGTLDGLRRDFDKMQDKEDYVDPQWVRMFGVAHRTFKAGNIADGIFELERALSHLDADWRSHA